MPSVAPASALLDPLSLAATALSEVQAEMLETVGPSHPGNNGTKNPKLRTTKLHWVVEVMGEMVGMEGRVELVEMVATEGRAAMEV